MAPSRRVVQLQQMPDKPVLFGTDGVRGVAGRYPLDRPTVASLGLALAGALRNNGGARRPYVLLGEDTRESSPWIVRALAGGLAAGGADVAHAGIITTPGVAFLTRHLGFSAGVMVSASHNPFGDNGVKVLSSAGTKLPETEELQVEQALLEHSAAGEKLPDSAVVPDPSLLQAYLSFLAGLAGAVDRIAQFRVVVDCANGAASVVVPALMKSLGVSARIMNAAPNGRNINLDSGSLHPQGMASETKTEAAALGVAFDGDADRAIFASPSGRVCDGDCVLFATAPFLNARKRLTGGAVVGTLMTNLGLELALRSQGIGLKRTPVGDKFVLEEMLRSRANLGGEPSGHIIFSDVSLAGDGIVTLIQMLRLLAETGQSMDVLMSRFKPFPQIIRNVRVREKLPLESVPEVATALARCQEELGERGRVVVRYSGTEPLARVMVEGEDAPRVELHTARIATAIAQALGQ
jgi:phosphoglucosamine mutase